MKVYWDIVQCTEPWHRIKYGKIGGSTSKGLLVESDTLLRDMIAARLEPFELEEEGFASADMLRGTELEPLARAAMSDYAGVEFKEAGWLECEEFPFLGYSPDGITECLTVMMEAKCPAKERHTATLLAKDIPLDNINQAIHAFTVNPVLEKLIWGSFRPESKYPLFVKELTRRSVVNIGTKAKPVMKPISDVVEMVKAKAAVLKANITVELTNLDKI